MNHSSELYQYFLSQDVRVIDSDGPFLEIDLSDSNKDFNALNTVDEFEAHLKKVLGNQNADAAFGGYNEVRNLYNDSDIFSNGPRNIHIGIDIWKKAGTLVYAALDGEIHSFNYNAGKGNYGPTIILKHELADREFFTLYGHLSHTSIEEIEIGDVIKQGETIGMLGTPSENGNYAPHLHFQIILDLEGNFGDFPGVVSKDSLTHYLSICPNPNLLLKLKSI